MSHCPYHGCGKDQAAPRWLIHMSWAITWGGNCHRADGSSNHPDGWWWGSGGDGERRRITRERLEVHRQRRAGAQGAGVAAANAARMERTEPQPEEPTHHGLGQPVKCSQCLLCQPSLNHPNPGQSYWVNRDYVCPHGDA